MPAPLPNEIRRQIVDRRNAGEQLTVISASLDLSYDTVRRIWRHWRKHGKLSPNYEKARQRGTRQYGAVYDEAIEMKRAHPKWGAQLIRLELQQRNPEAALPAVRTLQTWFQQAGVNRSSKVKSNRRQHVKRGKAVHEVWAVDAKEQMSLSDGSDVCWLTVTDEASGTILGCETFSPALLDTNSCHSSQSESLEDVGAMGDA